MEFICALIGIVVTLVGVCMAEPNYRNIVKHETIKEIERKLPTEIPIHNKLEDHNE